VLDLLADPLLVPWGDSLSEVLPLASSARLSLLLPADSTLLPPSQGGCPVNPTEPCPSGPAGLSNEESSPVIVPAASDVGLLLAVANILQTRSAAETAGNFVSAFAREAQGVRVIWGEATVIDSARMVTWALVSPQENQILAVGATMSLTFFDNQPQERGPGPAGAWASLDFPDVVRDTTFFNHLEIQSEPNGHVAPPGSVNPDRNRVPHFDFHFYAIPEEQVWAIPLRTPPLPAVPADRLPAGYLQPGFSQLQMGRHSSPVWSLTDPNPLSTIMIAGYLPDGSQMHFLEPMISRDFLLGKQDFTLPVPMPQSFGREMLYPTTFEATFQGNAYSFVFSDFVSVQ
jgi:hypothetical protein